MDSYTNKKDLPIYTAIAQNIRYALKKSGFTQTKLAEKLNVSQGTISNWCSGKKLPRADKIDALCKELKVSRSYILRDANNIAELPAAQALAQTHPRLSELFGLLNGMSDETLELVIRMVKAVSKETNGRRIPG